MDTIVCPFSEHIEAWPLSQPVQGRKLNWFLTIFLILGPMSLPLITTMDHAGVCSNMSTSVGGAELYQQLQQQHQQHQQVQKKLNIHNTVFV